jgi:hypothetical protein
MYTAYKKSIDFEYASGDKRKRAQTEEWKLEKKVHVYSVVMDKYSKHYTAFHPNLTIFFLFNEENVM